MNIEIEDGPLRPEGEHVRLEPWLMPHAERQLVHADDRRKLWVQVTAVPIVRGVAEVITYYCSGGLTWQTFGEGDYSTERMLEIHNANGEVIATHVAGTWLHVDWPAYYWNRNGDQS